MKSVVPVIDLSAAGRGNYRSRRGKLIEGLWFVVEAIIINNRLMPLSFVRVGLLRMFGASIGKGCRFLHAIRVKFPWNLTVGDRVWLGEGVWINNQAQVMIGSDACISQGSFLTTGSHLLATNMDLVVSPISIEDGVWLSSFVVVQRGVTIGRSAVVSPMSVVHKSLPAGAIYGGNPCSLIRRDRFEFLMSSK